jgi:hypothetical protein
MRILAVVLVWLLSVSCRTSDAHKVDLPQDPAGNLVLYVCNLSRYRRSIDTRIFIDGALAVDAIVRKDKSLMRVGAEQKEYRFRVATGEHVMRVTSEKGRARAETQFTMSERLWVSIVYAFTPEWGKGVPVEPQFSIEVQEKPILFQ